MKHLSFMAARLRVAARLARLPGQGDSHEGQAMKVLQIVPRKGARLYSAIVKKEIELRHRNRPFSSMRSRRHDASTGSA